MTSPVIQPRSKRSKTIRRIGIIGIGLAILLGYLLYPLASHDYDLPVDEKAIQEKNTFLTAPIASRPVARQPNIVVLVADDLGKTDISLYGNKIVRTSAIDSLAAQGVTFTEGYVTAAICSPSRAGLLTGRYQQRFGHELQPVNRYPKNRMQQLLAGLFIDKQQLEFANNTGIPTPENVARQGLPLGEITIADLLRKNGYATGIIGKWHLGSNEDFLPLKRGFDYHYGFYEAFAWYTDTTSPGLVNVHHKGVMDSHIWDLGGQGNSLVRRGNEIIHTKDYLTNQLAEEAVQFIDQHREKPFFLYVPFNAPHTPFQAYKKDIEKYEAQGVDRNKAVYYAMIEYLDRAIGKIHQKIRDAGLEDNTLIVFLSDNGGATYTDVTSNAPLKGGKLSLYDGGINVPYVVKWKGHIPEGITDNRPVSSLDIFATASAVSGSALPSGRKYDGVNLIPFLAKPDSATPHETLFWRAGSNKAVRKGEWKLVMNEKDNITALYNLIKDKEEKHNLAASYPEKVKDLQKTLNEWEKGLVKPLWPSTGYYRNEFDGVEDRYNL
ncbi:sulfatase-like hydrolase/transferase [Xanthocytophaga flava]|uniref:sulfatase-like hydrolase/transferase n=1 Tax=Xanthocytophaga flava TaxID=3048013 RepID=UPI0028D6E778|nr:sulfatase-like hydrolase/transferase [Xanthocytophaga flavus]MDJ1467722.1 sulfatase-like hydrolase/transferase [Xanthocytophaga flavus]